MTDKAVWDKEITVPASLIAYVDDAVIAKLPPGTTPTGIAPSGASYWPRTAKISATDADGNETAFFIKVHQGEHGKNMLPRRPGPDAHFFLCHFCEMSDDVPDPVEFTGLLAKLHKENPSPTGEFGFDLVTYGGRNPQFFPVTKSWEECFTKGMEMIFDAEVKTQGPGEELAELRKGFFELVIPRLLRPLETEGRTLTPRLVHGDLWDGNASVDVNTGRPMIFDPTPLYAHNEYEMAPWWCSRLKMTDTYINAYIRHFPVAEPVEDFNDRGLLYNMRFDMHASSLYPGNLTFRNLCKGYIKGLIQKYPLGYEGYLKEQEIDAAAIDATAINAASFNKNAEIEATVTEQSALSPDVPVVPVEVPVTEVLPAVN